MADTKIEWADRVWNPVTGCSRVSPGCANCYAARMAKRLAGRCGYPAEKPFAVTLHPDKLDEPLHWRTPARIFVNSMSDLFHADVPDDLILQVWDVMRQCANGYSPTRDRLLPSHTFLVLTKRPERMRDFFSRLRYDSHAGRAYLAAAADALGYRPVLPNVWLGVSAENQATADERIPLLLQTPAAVRFVSCEPLLRIVDLNEYMTLTETNDGMEHYEKHGWGYDDYSGGFIGTEDACYDPQPGIHWVIAGGETGPGARPMHPDWARRLRDQCLTAEVPFFFKSWGDWKPISQMDDGECDALYHPAPERDPEAIRRCKVETTVLQLDGSERREWPPGAMLMFRVGKKRAGHLLDSQEYSEFPVTAQ